MCAAHKRLKPCDACKRASETLKQRWPHGTRKDGPERMLLGNVWWFKEEGEIVMRLAGRASPVTITAEVNRLRKTLGLVPRTRASIMGYADRHAVSTVRAADLYSLTEVQNMFGVTHPIISKWCKRGWLHWTEWGNSRVFSNDDLRQFVTDFPWVADSVIMQSGWLRDYMQVTGRRDPWLTSRKIAALVPIGHATLINYIHRGDISAHQRPGRNGVWMMQASVVWRIRELLAENMVRRQNNVVRVRRNKAA